jgi:hypothetical protein
MIITILKAQMKYDEELGYTGQVEFEVAGHKSAYEITMYSKKGKEWSYGLHFLGEPGKEEEIFALEEYIEDHDECFDQFIEAGKSTLDKDHREISTHKLY